MAPFDEENRRTYLTCYICFTAAVSSSDLQVIIAPEMPAVSSSIMCTASRFNHYDEFCRYCLSTSPQRRRIGDGEKVWIIMLEEGGTPQIGGQKY